LHLIVQSAAHPLFERDGDDLWGRLPVDVADAALGTTVELPALDGKVSVKVPAGTQPGSVLSLRGKGLPTLNASTRGDLLLRVQVRVPQHLSSDERTLFERLRELRSVARPLEVRAPS